MQIDEILQHFHGVKPTESNTWLANCPAHDDINASMQIKAIDGKVLLHCFAGCQTEAIVKAVGLDMKSLFSATGNAVASSPKKKYGLTLAEYAAAKKLPVDFLRKFCGMEDGMHQSKKGNVNPGVKLGYYGPKSEPLALRWRMALGKGTGTNGQDLRFLWEKGAKLSLYGLWRQPKDKKKIILVEGESDCHTLWYNGFAALGLPGASNYKPDRDDKVLSQYETIYLIVEPDQGGKSLFEAFAGNAERQTKPSAIIDKIRFTTMPPETKDVSAVWMQNPNKASYQKIIQSALDAAQPAKKFKKPWEPDKRQVTSPENGNKGGRPKTDYFAAAKKYAASLKNDSGEFMVRHWRESWYEWVEHSHYVQIPDTIMENRIMAWLQTSEDAAANGVAANRGGVANMMMGIRSTGLLGMKTNIQAPCWISKEESAEGYLPMANGILNIDKAAEYAQNGVTNSGQILRPSTPDLLVTYGLPYAYDPTAKCPKFQQYLDMTLPDKNLQDAALMMMGLSLVPDTSFNVAFFLAGQAGTGKSTFLEVLQALIGHDNCCHVDLLSMDKTFRTYPLTECLLNVVGELPTEDPQGRMRYVEGFFKDTVSGGMIAAERKHKDAVSARCIARHVFATNALPVFFDKSDGIWDRIVIIPFNRKIRGTKNEIRDFKSELIEELPGILNLALAALARLRAHGVPFPEPEACRLAKQEHRDRCDIESVYLREAYTLQDSYEGVGLADAYSKYVKYLEENGLARRSSLTFQMAVQRMFGVKARPRSKTDRIRILPNLRYLEPKTETIDF